MRIHNLHEAENLSKLVQLEVKGEVVAGFNNYFHTDALKKTLDAEGVEYEIGHWGPDNCVSGPKPEGREYRVIGMGRMKIDATAKTFGMPCMYSGDYGMEPNEEHSQLLVKELESMGWTKAT